MEGTRTRRDPQAGFGVIEALVATVIAVCIVVAIGLVSENLARRRASSDVLSAAVDLGERQMERLFALPNPATNADLTAGVHGPVSSGPFQLQWTVTDNSASGTPLVDGSLCSKKLVVTVTHNSDRYANVNLQTYYVYR